MKKNYELTDYELMLDFFMKNKTRKTTGDELKRLFGLNTIKLQSIIHDMRCNGIPILSYGNSGYGYNTNKEEIMKCYTSLMGRALSIIHSANGLQNYLEENV